MSLRKFSGLMLLAVAGTAQVADGQEALENLEKQLLTPPVAAAPVEEPGYLGIIADDRETAGRGIRLIDVLATGPAAKAGLQVGDTITSIDGVQVKSLDDMAKVMVGRVVGEEVSFVATRGIEAVRVDVVLTKRPPPEERRFSNFGRITNQATDIVTPNDMPPGSIIATTPGTRTTPNMIPSPPNRLIPHPAPPTVPSAAALPSTDSLPAPEPVTSVPQGERPPAVPTIASTQPVIQTPTTIAPLSPRGTLKPVDPNSPLAANLRTGLLGLRTTRVTPELQLAMNLPEPRGALVIEVRPDSPAKAVGIPIDAVIVAADGKRIEGPDDLWGIVAERGAGAELKLSYYRYGQLYEKTVKLVAPPPVVVAEVPTPPNSLRPSTSNTSAPSPSPSKMEPSVGLPPTTVPPAAAPPSTQPPAALPPLNSAGPALAPSQPVLVKPAPAAAPTASSVDESEAAQIRKQIRDLEAQLRALEKRLPPEEKK